MMGIHVIIDGAKLICYEDGVIDRFNPHTQKWQEVPQTPHKITTTGYERLEFGLNGKIYLQSRILAHVYYNFDLNSDLQIDHIDGNSLNNSVNNLRIVTHLQNQWNKNAKGYCKRKNGFQAELQANGLRYFQCFKTEPECIKWRSMMKAAFHSIV
jgi:hypothetical protein